MKIKALVVAAALLAAGAANAQESYVTNSYDSNLFASFSLGANGYIGSFHGPFGMGFALEASAGKWVTPEAGFRVNVSGISVGDEGSFLAAGGDLLWDATTTFGGYNPERKLSVVPYVHANLKGKLRGAGLGAGMMFPIALNEKWAIVPDFRAIFYNEGVFGKGEGRCLSGHVLVGAQYSFGKTNTFQTKDEVLAPAVLAATAAEAAKAAAEAQAEKVAAEKAAAEAENAKLAKENEDLKNEINSIGEMNKAIVKNLMNTPACVYFEIGQATLSVKELEHFDRVVKTMLSQDKNITFTVAGYSDKNTGSAKRNHQLAQQRANYIVKLLTTKYGLSKDQFVVKADNSNTNVFTTIELNRAVIIEAAE